MGVLPRTVTLLKDNTIIIKEVVVELNVGIPNVNRASASITKRMTIEPTLSVRCLSVEGKTTNLYKLI